PIALGFQSEDELIALPAIADLPTEQTSGTIAAAVAEHGSGEYVIPAIVALAPTAVCADVEAGPVVDRDNHGRWRRLDGHISSRGGPCQSRKCDCTQQNFFHVCFCASSLRTRSDITHSLGPLLLDRRNKMATLKHNPQLRWNRWSPAVLKRVRAVSRRRKVKYLVLTNYLHSPAD